MRNLQPQAKSTTTSCARIVAVGAAAGAMGWGIRGQYGHETGAMIAGSLAGLALVIQLRPRLNALIAVRAAALCTVAMGFGGAMTYGQTIGLTQNPEVAGNWPAFFWGMLGLGIKGALWIGFAGAFLGMGLSAVRYRPTEMALLLSGMVLLVVLGVSILNQPFDPANRVLPRLYFSADWSWYTATGAEILPRKEIWGGLLFALAGLLIYIGHVREDRLARNLALWGCLGGLGFPLGQCIQAWHAWNPSLFRTGIGAAADQVVNWWNFMEIIFGMTWGSVLGLGLWFNRKWISQPVEAPAVNLSPGWEVLLLCLHVPLLCCLEFATIPWLEAVGDLGIPWSLLPLIAIVGGRFWPYWMVLPVTALPILGKTLKSFNFFDQNPLLGWILAGLAFAALLFASSRMARYARTSPSMGAAHLSRILLAATWLYFALNFAFFDFPWPWRAWTPRTLSALVFAACAILLTLSARSPACGRGDVA